MCGNATELHTGCHGERLGRAFQLVAKAHTSWTLTLKKCAECFGEVVIGIANSLDNPGRDGGWLGLLHVAWLVSYENMFLAFTKLLGMSEINLDGMDHAVVGIHLGVWANEGYKSLEVDVLQVGLWIAGTFSLSHEEGIGNQCCAGPVFRVLYPMKEGVKLKPMFGGGESCQEDCLKVSTQRGALARGSNSAKWSQWRMSARSQSGEDLPGQGGSASN